VPKNAPPPPRGKKPDDTIREALREEPTAIDGPRVRAHNAPPLGSSREDTKTDPTNPLADAELLSFDDADELSDDDDLEPTRHRGSHPPKPSVSRRLSPTLMKIFQRRREQIGLTIKQVARLAGLEEEEYARFEGTQGQHRLVYDHAVVLARVLGVKPQDMPGLRAKDSPDDVAAHVADIDRMFRAGLTLTFEGASGERFGGDVERVAATRSFAVVIGDVSLAPAFPPKTLLGFVAQSAPAAGQVVLLRHRKSKLLAMRRFTPPSYAGLAQWQPAYVASSGEWLCVGRLQVILPP
jgi:transcriptional regulator with XRE-family HTH domain